MKQNVFLLLFFLLFLPFLQNAHGARLLQQEQWLQLQQLQQQTFNPVESDLTFSPFSSASTEPTPAPELEAQLLARPARPTSELHAQLGAAHRTHHRAWSWSGFIPDLAPVLNAAHVADVADQLAQQTQWLGLGDPNLSPPNHLSPLPVLSPPQTYQPTFSPKQEAMPMPVPMHLAVEQVTAHNSLASPQVRSLLDGPIAVHCGNEYSPEQQAAAAMHNGGGFSSELQSVTAHNHYSPEQAAAVSNGYSPEMQAPHQPAALHCGSFSTSELQPSIHHHNGYAAQLDLQRNFAAGGQPGFGTNGPFVPDLSSFDLHALGK